LSQKLGLAVLLGAAILLGAILYVFGPIPNPEHYHHFADQRSWLGIPNTLNVISNAIFAVAGLWGIILLFSPRIRSQDYRERWLYAGVAIGLLLTSIGSSYYHLAPDNSRLVWDRLPMTLVFMSFVAMLIAERINVRFALWLWPLLVACGFYSVFLWQISGDLRFYIGVQAFTVLAALIMMLLPSRHYQNKDLGIVVVCYGTALLLDLTDHQVFSATGGVISGHTIKHLIAGIAGAYIVHMIAKLKAKRQEERYK
jgi:hypothetical protein